VKVHLVVTAPSPSGTHETWPPVEQVLRELGRVRSALPSAWVVATGLTERDLLARVRVACGDELEVVVVRLDLGGYAATLRMDVSLSSWCDTVGAGR